MSISVALRPTHRARRWLAAAALAVGTLGATGLVLDAGSASAATLGDVFVVASAHSNCGSHTVTVWPMTNEPLDGLFSVYSYAQVWDYDSAQWITTNWLLGNGIQGHIFYNMRNFYPYAYVTYARVVGGAWTFQRDVVEIVPDLDSMGAFCNP